MTPKEKQIRFEKALEDLTVEVLYSGWEIDWVDGPKNQAEGLFSSHDKKIIMMVDNSLQVGLIEPILFVMAHEVRHLQHYKSGIFKDYYREEHETSLDLFSETGNLPIGYVPPMPWVGIRAESDCNRWAVSFMKERGFHYEPKNYAICDVMGYDAFLHYRRANSCQRGKKAPCNQRASS